jgi:ABC-type Fe3+-hydroxamate transport system substrate-binding protein
MKDQLNRTVEFSQVPKRIVSLVPSQTELLVDLGLSSEIVGITKFCVHPKSLRKEKLVLGGTKTVNYHKVAALNPDIIICNKEENSEEIVRRCAEICTVWVSDIYTVSDSLEMIKSLGSIFMVSEKALEICRKIRSEIKDFREFMNDKPTRKVAYLIWKRPYMIAGNKTFINDLLKLNKFQNINQTPASRYPELELADLELADLILLSSEPFPFKESDVHEMKAILNTEIQLVNGEFFSWYGSRLTAAFRYFKTLH